MKRKKYIVLASICFFALLFFCESLFQPADPVTKAHEIANQITIEFAKEMQQKYGLQPLGIGGGGNKGLNLLSIHFKLDRKIEVVEARAMYVSIVQDFLEKINNTKDIRSILLNYPFELKNTQIWISCYDSNNYRFENPYVSFISLSDDNIIYKAGGTKYEPFETLCEEPFKDALRMVLEQQTQKDTSPDHAVNALQFDFAKKMKREYQLEAIGTGGGGQNGINLLFLGFKSEEIFDLNKVRPLVINCTNEFLNCINADEKIRPFLENHHFKINNIFLMFGFYKNEKYPPEGKIASICLRDGKIHYSTYNHYTQRLQTNYNETFEEATQKVQAIQEPAFLKQD